MNFLKHFRVYIDYSSGKIDFLPHNRIITKLDQHKSITLPLGISLASGYVPYIKCKINNKTQNCMLDTGASSVLMIPFDAADSQKSLKAEGQGSGGAFGLSNEVMLTRIDSLQLGSSQENAILLKNQSATATWEKYILGKGFLENYKIPYDFPGSKITLQSAGTSPTGYFSIGLGLMLDEKDNMIVRSVLIGSPAYGKIKPRDEIIEIGNLNATAKNLPLVYDLLTDDNSKIVKVKYRRDGKIHDIELEKANLP